MARPQQCPLSLRYQCGLLAPRGVVPSVAALFSESSIAGTVLGFFMTRALAGFIFI
jgi:hypothetical protein